jgi:acetone carboxylase gamma subunit
MCSYPLRNRQLFDRIVRWDRTVRRVPPYATSGRVIPSLEFMAEADRDGTLVIPISRKLPLSKAADAQRRNNRVGSGRSCWCLELFAGETSKGKSTMKRDRRGFNLASKPSGDGCVECLASPNGWWLHLRRCAECGHIGCCDSSPSQHASKHAAATGHPIIASFEPDEDWFYDYETHAMIPGVELPPPHAHPESQPVPGPAGRVPLNWESLLH